MRRISLTLSIEALVCLSLPPAASAQDDGWTDDTLRALIPGPVGSSDLDLPWFVWSQDQTPDDPNTWASDVYALNLDTGEIVPVATGPADQSFPDACDGVVTWSESGAILGKHPASGQTFSINPGSSDATGAPGDSCRWVAWLQHSGEPSNNGERTIYARDIQAMTDPVKVATVSSNEVSVDVSGDLIGWLEGTYAEDEYSRIEVRNLVTGETVARIEEPGHVYPFDIDGTTLVYGHRGVTVRDLRTGATRVLPAGIHNNEGGFPITTDGRFVIWQLGGTFGYDVLQDAWFQLPFDRHSTELDDGMLAWSQRHDWEKGPTEIHTAPAAEFSSGQRSRYFPETDQWLALGFVSYWGANGGLPVFGYPLTAQGTLDSELFAQWFERQRFEQHPEHAGSPYDVLLGLLGSEDADARGLRTTAPFQPLAPSDGGDDRHVFFPVTGHWLSNGFKVYWETHGLDLGDPGISYQEALALFGYPISEEYTDPETGLTIQYFERAIFEWHPRNQEPFKVLLRRLGAEALAARDW